MKKIENVMPLKLTVISYFEFLNFVQLIIPTREFLSVIRNRNIF